MSGGAALAPGGAAPSYQHELLMERLRTKNSQYKNLADTSKAVRMTMLDKRWALDSADRTILQKCLDSLQHRIKICSLQSLVERLECLSRQLGLKFMVGASGVDLFISSDMFYLEIILESSGAVKDVKIHHDGKSEQQSCEELVSCISKGDFTDFTTQLEGLTAVYQLNAQKNIKCKAFSALTALETDLGTLSQLQVCLKDPWKHVHKSPIGYVHKRRGGHAMRLTYFISPYEIARLPNGILTVEALANGSGLSALLLLESAPAHRLQLSPLVTLPQRLQPNNGPTYAPLGPNNSATLPARFILKLSQAMPICGALLKNITAAGEPEGNPVMSPNQTTPVLPTMKPLLSLVAQNAAASADINPNKGLFVTLPDQSQCYFLTETNGLDGCIIESVPFTHPRQVPTLIARLRQQALFNTLISSCVRPNSKQDVESSIMVEVSALSWQHISICLEQPGEDGLATLELELPEGGGSPRVSIQGGGTNNGIYEEYLARVLQRTLSVPLTVRALLARWERDSRPGFSGGAGGLEPGGPPTSPRQHFSSHSSQNNFLNESHQNLTIFGNQDGSLASIISNSNNSNLQSSQIQMHNVTGSYEDKKSKKRKSDYDIGNINKKSKPQVVCEVLLESSSSNSDTAEDSDVDEDDNIIQSDSSNDEDDEIQPSPTSQPGFVSDLELSGLDPTELIGGSSNDNKTSCSEFENSGDGETSELQDMDELIRTTSNTAFEPKKHKSKSREHRSNKINSSLLMELEGGGFMPPSVSITPITSNVPAVSTSDTSPNFTSALTGMGLDRRPGIEIIPITTNQPTGLSSSITIIPISTSQSKSLEDRHRSERKSCSNKSSRSSSSDRSKDKKKKKRRDDSMGPPDKLPPKQDPLTKPVSVSIKPTDRSHSPLSMRSTSPNTTMRKFSPSPTHGRPVSIAKSSGSPSGVKSKSSGSSSYHNSPRHSPVQSSPKHSLSGYSSPKNHGVSSPKHSSGSGSSGKPSMSTLKSAASGSPSGKSSNSNYDISKLKGFSLKDSSALTSTGSRDKERKSSNLSYSGSGSSSPKLKSSTVKLKQLEVSVALTDTNNMSTESITSPIVDLGKVATPSQVRNRKGSLSAVIDKLKSAQHCGSDLDIPGRSSSSGSSGSSKERTNTGSNRVSESRSSGTNNSSKSSDIIKTQEYMVKPSSDGMKITINKTRTKDSNSSSMKSNFGSNMGSNSFSSNTKQTSGSHSTSGTGSPKTHTGLKPGVISGPASKKTQVLQSSKTGSSFNASNMINSPQGGVNKSNQGNASSGSSKLPFMKSSSSSNLSGSGATKTSSKMSTGSPKMSNNATDLSKLGRDREKSRSNKSSSLSGSNSDKSIFASSKSNERRLSPAPSRDDVDGERALKSISQHNKEQSFSVEGIIKSLDTSNKYQIPKLSARISSDESNKLKNSEKNSIISNTQSDMSSILNRTTSNDSKLLDFSGRSPDIGSKYFSKFSDQIQKNQSSMASSISKPAINLSSTSPKMQSNPISLTTTSKSSDSTDNLQSSNYMFSSIKNTPDISKDLKSLDSRSNMVQHQSLSNSREDSNPSKEYTKSYPAISVCSTETINQSIKQLDTGIGKTFSVNQHKMNMDELPRKNQSMLLDNKVASMIKPLTNPTHEGSDMLLDFSSSSSSKATDVKNKMAERAYCLGTGSGSFRRHTPPLTSLGQSPSVSVHIVKSPVPSPHVLLSPHSNSPCITDDELMDEAVVGPGK